MKIMDLKKISRVNSLLLGAAVLLAALAIAITANGAWSRLRSWAPYIDKAQTALLAQVATWPPPNNTFYVQSYGGKCLTFSAPVRGLAFGGGRVFISDCNRTASQQIRVEELTDRPGHLVVLHAGAGVIGKQAYQVFSGPALLSAQSSISSEAQVQLEVQSYTGSAGQIFALDGDSIILAEDRNLVVEVQNNRGANGTPLVLGRRDLADSEFWTFSATDDSTRRPTSGFAHVSETRDFVNAVATANPGTVIEVDPSATINLKDQPPLRIPAGVTIRGDRRGASLGPELSALNEFDQIDAGGGVPGGMLQIAGDNVRITGLRMHGPSREVDKKEPLANGIFAPDRYISIIDHNDMSDWTVAAINIVGDDDSKCCAPWDNSRPQNIRVARNFIHHNQNVYGDGLGYGVVTGNGGYPSVEGNTFLSNIHSIAGDGTARSGYRAWFNLVLSKDPGHGYDFDMHGTEDTCGDHCGGTFGDYIEIARNSFLSLSRFSFKLRGTPCYLAEFHDNVSSRSLNGAIENHAAASKLSVNDTNRFGGANLTGRLGVGDFDGDRKDDLFLATGAAWYYAPAGKAEWRYLNAQTEKIGSLMFGDFDGDGRTDVFTQHGRDWLVSWGGASAWEKINESDARMSDFAIGDFDGDHRADVFYANGQAWYVSSGGVGPFKLFDTSSFRISDLRFGDFNGDGKTDVFGVANGAWSVTYAGTVNWSFLRPRLTDSVAGLIVADFNGDGRADIARSDCSLFGGCDWQVSYGGAGDWTTLRSGIGSLVSAAAIGRFDGEAGADVLLWHDNYLAISSRGSGASQRHSNQDMR